MFNAEDFNPFGTFSKLGGMDKSMDRLRNLSPIEITICFMFRGTSYYEGHLPVIEFPMVKFHNLVKLLDFDQVIDVYALRTATVESVLDDDDESKKEVVLIPQPIFKHVVWNSVDAFKRKMNAMLAENNLEPTDEHDEIWERNYISDFMNKAQAMYLKMRKENDERKKKEKKATDNPPTFEELMQRWQQSFNCSNCDNEDHEHFAYSRTVANGEVWICDHCKAETVVEEMPNEDKMGEDESDKD